MHFTRELWNSGLSSIQLISPLELFVAKVMFATKELTFTKRLASIISAMK